METPALLSSMSECLASRLVGVCLRLLVALLERGSGLEEDKLGEDRSALHEVYARLKIWAADYDIEGDLLDRVLEFSEYLKEPTVSFLIDLAEGLRAYESGIGLLGDSAEELGTVHLLLQSAGREPLGDEERGYEEGTDDDESESESRSSGDDESESESQSSECSAIHDIQDAVDSLYNLSPALNFFLETFSPPDTVETVGPERMIRHMFPHAEAYLIERLSIRIAGSREKLAQPASFLAEARTGTTGPLPKNQVQKSHFVDSGLGSSVPTMARPSERLWLPLRPENLVPLPSVAGLRKRPGPGDGMDRCETQSTVSSQRAEITDRLPPMPKGALDGPFICNLCSRQGNRLFTPKAWRMHVFEDIQPYVCIHKDCSSANTPYGSVQLCTKHHQSSHPNECHPACPLCGYLFESDRTEIKRYEHIFKHMERIGLFSLPSHLGDTGDEGCPLSSASNARSEASASGVTRSEETKSPEFLRWDRLKEQKVERYDNRKIKQWVGEETELIDGTVDEVPEIEPGDEDGLLSSPTISTPADVATGRTRAEEKKSDDSLRAAQRNEETMEGNEETMEGSEETMEGNDELHPGQRADRQIVFNEENGKLALEQHHITEGFLINFAETYCADDAAFNSRRMEHEPACLPGTRVGLLQEAINWSNTPGDACIFWLNGMAGTGKSTIARTVARIWDDKKQLGASFFFSRVQGDLAHASKFFPTLAYQLARSQSSLTANIHKAIHDRPDITRQSLRDQWKHLILEPLSQLNDRPEPLVVVIDALDECDDEDDIKLILHLLSKAKDLSSVQLRVFITSRPETPIRLGFHAIPGKIHRDFILHEISDSVVGHDISVFLRHEFGMIRTRRRLPEEWPTEDNLHLLVRKASGLFIYAATVCRFVGHKDSSPEKRLNFVLQDSMEDGSPTEQLDLIYTKILQYAVGDRQERLLRFRQIVGSIVVLSSALTATALGKLLQTQQGDVEFVLEALSAVLTYSDKQAAPIWLIHPSFRDFLLSGQRCSDPRFRIDSNDAHKALAMNCLELMSSQLRQDICSLRLPGTLTSEVDHYVVQSCLPEEVQYACKYWVDHLRRSEIYYYGSESMYDQVDNFLKTHFTHWLEALSLTGNMSYAALAVGALAAGFTHSGAMARDAMRFVLYFSSIMKVAPLQVYSVIALAPKASLVRQQFWRAVPRWILDLPVVPEDWDSTLQVLHGHTNRVNAVQFSPDGRLLASASNDHTIRLWDPVTGTCLTILKGHSSWVTAATFSPDGRLLASASNDQTIRLWDPMTGTCRTILEGHSSWVTAATFSPDAKLLSSASGDQTIRLWDPMTGTCRTILEGHSSWVTAATFSPDGRLLASASVDTTVRLWDPASKARLGTPADDCGSVTEVVFSLDGKLLSATMQDQSVRLWDCGNGCLLRAANASELSHVSFPGGHGAGAAGGTAKFPHPTRLHVSEDWISYGTQKIFLLPFDYRATCFAVRDNMIALGHRSGRVTFMRFDLDSVPLG